MYASQFPTAFEPEQLGAMAVAFSLASAERPSLSVLTIARRTLDIARTGDFEVEHLKHAGMGDD